MKKTYLFLVFFSILLLYITITSPFTTKVLSLSNHIVISEIQVGGLNAEDEFVELYNPTGQAISLAGWRLTRKNEVGNEGNLANNITGTIPAYGYFLITSTTSSSSPSANMLYTVTSRDIPKNGTALLYSDAGVTLVDKVGMGSAADFETTAAASLNNFQSIERKANSTSTALTMGTGGIDETAGNGEDTDHNGNDFVLRTLSNPQNSSSAAEIPIVPTPTPTLTTTPTSTLTPTLTESPTPTLTETPTPTMTSTPSPTETPTESPTPTTTPTETPTNTPSPTVTPSATPTNTATPSPKETPTSTPTVTLTPTEIPTSTPTLTPTESPTTTPTVSPSLTPSVTLTPTVTPTISPSQPTATPTPQLILNTQRTACYIRMVPLKTFFFTFSFPQFYCVTK